MDAAANEIMKLIALPSALRTNAHNRRGHIIPQCFRLQHRSVPFTLRLTASSAVPFSG